MLKTEDLILTPENKDIRIWRYLDFSKYVSMLESKALFFSRADRLGDEHEGATTQLSRAIFHAQMTQMIEKKHVDEGLEQMEKMHLAIRKLVYINSWHMNNDENYAMWKIYSRGSNSIAIVSNYKKLRNCLANSIHISAIRYIDYDNFVIPRSNYLAPYIYKRKQYAYEKELRAFKTGPWPGHPMDLKEDEFPAGEEVIIGLEKLIEKVVVSPFADVWFADLVKTLTGKYEFAFPVEYSSLKSKPIF
ncbi:MAG: hypothetical protein DWQ07_06390 [Chloroflexi bacterium]|nr:MAG: hypothetical protein DWQ07_06390 [Chloroflexota bacterium]MBL1195942.1 hypothetical protein [Chloroflexota bacterium]NOH13235.1 hypothetical protein [Chloroflexota bacterium]